MRALRNGATRRPSQERASRSGRPRRGRINDRRGDEAAGVAYGQTAAIPPRAAAPDLRWPPPRRMPRAAPARPRAPRERAPPTCRCRSGVTIDSLPLSSRNSHARARVQSRRTVPTETCSTSAVSSRLSPPKKRSSTTWLSRGFSVSSVSERIVERDEIVAAAPAATSETSSSDTRIASPPRLTRSRACAAFTRMRRMIPAATPKKCARFCHSHVLPVDEPDVDLVDERRWLEQVAGSLPGHLT